eukprot:3961642-Pleurochrysis_carterae.AAC.1
MDRYAVEGSETAADADADADADAAPPSAPPSAGGRCTFKYELECMALRQRIDAQQSKIAALEADVAASDKKA